MSSKYDNLLDGETTNSSSFSNGQKSKYDDLFAETDYPQVDVPAQEGQPTPAKNPGLLSKIGTEISNAGYTVRQKLPAIKKAAKDSYDFVKQGVTFGDPKQSQLSTDATANTLAYLPGEIARRAPIIGPYIHLKRDDPEAFKYYNPVDMVKELPSAAVKVPVKIAQAIPRSLVKGGLDIANIATGNDYEAKKGGVIDTALGGDVANESLLSDRAIAAGADPFLTRTMGGINTALDIVSLLGVVKAPFQSIPVTVAKGTRNTINVEGSTTGGYKAIEAPWYRHSEKTTANVMNKDGSMAVFGPEHIAEIKSQGGNISPKYNPNQPVYMRVETQRVGDITRETQRMVQIKPSLVERFFKVFKGDISKVPNGYVVDVTTTNVNTQVPRAQTRAAFQAGIGTPSKTVSHPVQQPTAPITQPKATIVPTQQPIPVEPIQPVTEPTQTPTTQPIIGPQQQPITQPQTPVQAPIEAPVQPVDSPVIVQPKPIQAPVATTSKYDYLLEPTRAVTPEEQRAEADTLGLSRRATNDKGYVKPALGKTGLKEVAAIPGFAEYPVVTVNADKDLEWNNPSGNGRFIMSSDALGPIKDNLQVGQTINISKKSLTRVGAHQQTRVYTKEKDNNKPVASIVKKPRVEQIKVPKSDAEIKQRIDQLNKFGQTNAILRTSSDQKKSHGLFDYKGSKSSREKGEVRLSNKLSGNVMQQLSTLTHELTHGLEYRFNGIIDRSTRYHPRLKASNPRHTKRLQQNKEAIESGGGMLQVFGKDLSPSEYAVIHNELIQITRNLVGKIMADSKPNYYYSNTELLARFFQSMIHFPDVVMGIAPNAVYAINVQGKIVPIINDMLKAIKGMSDTKASPAFIRDREQIYQQALGSNIVGTKAFNLEQRLRNERQRAISAFSKFITDKFKGVDKEEHPLIYETARAVHQTIDGKPQFGTFDIVAVGENESQIMQAKLDEGYTVRTNSAGVPTTIIVQEGSDKVRKLVLEKERYTKEEGEEMYNQLSDAGKRVVQEFTSIKEQAQDVFNRELMKEFYKVNSTIEDWVHAGIKYKDNIQKSYSGKKLKYKKAGATYQRTGDGSDALPDLQAQTYKALIEHHNAKTWNEFIREFLATTTKPLLKGEEPDEGWMLVSGDLSRGVGTPRETGARMVATDAGDIMYLAQTGRLQIPKAIYENYKLIHDEIEMTGALNNIVDVLNTAFKVSVLGSASAAGANIQYGLIQYATKIVSDFIQDATMIQGYTSGFKQTRRNMFALAAVLMPNSSGWFGTPDWVYGGDATTDYGQYQVPVNRGDNKLKSGLKDFSNASLKVLGFTERYFKKVLTYASTNQEFLNNMKTGNIIGKEGLPELSKENKELMDIVNEMADLYALDYSNVPTFIAKNRRSSIGKMYTPFLTAGYKVFKNLVIKPFEKLFDTNLSTRERTKALITLAIMMMVAAVVQEKQNRKSKIKQLGEIDKLPGQFTSDNYVFIGTDKDGNEKFKNASNIIYSNVYNSIDNIASGDVQKGGKMLFQSIIGGFGPVGKAIDEARGMQSEYEDNLPEGVIGGREVGTFIPFSRQLSNINDISDDISRKQTNFTQGALGKVPMPSKYRGLLQGEQKTIRVPKEGAFRFKYSKGDRETFDMPLTKNKTDAKINFFGVGVKTLDPKVIEAYSIRAKENQKKAQDKEDFEKRLKEFKAQYGN